MSTISEAASEAERIAFLKLEKWLVSIFGRIHLSDEEQYVGTGLISAVRVSIGLPPLPGAPSAAAPPRTEAEIEARRFGEVLPHLHVVEDPEADEERETRELSTAEEIAAPSYLGHGNNL